jgi:putative protease
MVIKNSLATGHCEVMAPVGDMDSLAAAIQGGAHSVYFGVEQLNMRAKSTKNFTLDDMEHIAKKCQKYKMKCYLTLNTILYDHDTQIMKKMIDRAKESGVNAVIASDVAVFQYANSIGFPVHISTQANVCNVETLKFYTQFADVVVLARELTLTQIQRISQAIQEEQIKGFSGELMRIEVFAHGALCVAVSGKCFMSLTTQNSSANRGACNQTCRKSYTVTDNETGVQLVLDNEYIMSPKDLCTIDFIDQLYEAGVSVFKIEGRGRAADYVYKVTRGYREMLDDCLAGKFDKEKAALVKEAFYSVYNRGFWEGGYYMGKELGEWSGKYGSHATVEKEYVGLCTKYYAKSEAAEVMMQSGKIKIGDKLMFIGPTTGVVEFALESIHFDNGNVEVGQKDQMLAIKVPRKIRKNDRLYILKERAESA